MAFPFKFEPDVYRDGRQPSNTKESDMYGLQDGRKMGEALGQAIQSPAREREIGAGLANQINNQQVRDRALMEQTVAEVRMAVEGLDKQVEELLMRIAPVCQPAEVVAASQMATLGGVGGNQQSAPISTPSPLRGELMHLHARIAAISSRISAVRYTIEI